MRVTCSTDEIFIRSFGPKISSYVPGIDKSVALDNHGAYKFCRTY